MASGIAPGEQLKQQQHNCKQLVQLFRPAAFFSKQVARTDHAWFRIGVAQSLLNLQRNKFWAPAEAQNRC
jgi:hypothetical protein